MATFKSAELTELDATDGLEVQKNGGRLRHAVANITVDTTYGAGDIAQMMKIPRNAILSRMTIYPLAALTGGTDVNVGDPNDRDGLMDGIDLTEAGIKHIGNGDGGDGGAGGWNGAADSYRQLWEVLGYTTERDAPSLITIEMEFVTDVTLAAPGTILAMVAEYVVD